MSKSTWARVLDEFNAVLKEAANSPPPQGGKAPPWAQFLADKIDQVTQKTGRPLVVYASACTSSAKGLSSSHLQIDQSDRVGFRDMFENLEGPNVDLLLHSPGGFPEAAESIVQEIRRNFTHVRVVVPAYAKSAATMIAMAGNEILLDPDAELGPIDPQMITPNGIAPAEAIKEQFQKAEKAVQSDPTKIAIWMPILQPMGPSLLVQCDNAIRLSKDLVRDWLSNYMFAGTKEATEKASKVVDYLSDHKKFKSHARSVKLEHLKPFDLALVNLRNDPDLHRFVWELYCTVDILFANTPMYKILYNSVGDAMVRQTQAIQLVGQPGPPGLGPVIPPQKPPTINFTP